MIKINISKDFSDTPGGRYEKDGKNSGEKFRKELLYPKYMEAVKTGEKLQINFDGCYGYPSSFIDESFGGLSRELNDKDILDNMELVSNDQPSLMEFVRVCIKGKKTEK